MSEDISDIDVRISGRSEIRLKKRRAQYLAAVKVCMGGFALGCGLGWNAPTIELLKRDQKFDLIYNDFIAAAFMLGAAFGVLIVPFFINKIERRLMTRILIVPFIGGWVIIAFADNDFYWYVIGRFITGACGGIFCITAPLYSAEIAEDDNRGAMGVFFHLLLVIGILFAYCTGFTRDIVWISALNGLTPIVAGIIMAFIPETPLFYLMKNKEDSARRVLQFFRGKDVDIEPEMIDLKENVDNAKSTKMHLQEFLKKPVRKTLGIAYGMMGVQQLSGINAIIFYAVTIFQATGVDLDPVLQGVVLGVVQVIACCLSALLIDKIGRKALMLLSEITMCLCLLALSGFFMLKELYPQMAKEVYWLPLVAMCIYVLGFCIGAGPVPWAYMAEIFPTKLKGTAAASAAFVNWLLAFFITLSFESLVNVLGNAGVLFIFSLICALSTLFVAMCVIETKGKSLVEIQKAFGILQLIPRVRNT